MQPWTSSRSHLEVANSRLLWRLRNATSNRFGQKPADMKSTFYVSQRENSIGLYCFMLAAETNHTRRKDYIDALDITETKEAAARDEYDDC